MNTYLKGKGTCYLFDCGTLDEFKCRLSPHSYYTSSVLQVNRNSFLLNEWKSQTNQENELTSLKDKLQISRSKATDTDKPQVIQSIPPKSMFLFILVMIMLSIILFPLI